MGKTRDTGKLATQIQFDNNNNLIIGSSPSSILDISGSIEAGSITGSFTGSVFGLGDVVSFSSSVNSDLNSIHNTTSSNITKITNLENKTGSLATTGSNTFFGTQTFSGSVYIANDLIVQGSSSIQYITGSSVNIGTNIVQLNTANPSVRFAGLTIIDSGSIGGSGSFLYDSVQDEFIFVHRGNGTNVTSSHFVLGPETYDSLGNETYLTCNTLSKGTGKEHLVDSCIFDNGTTTCIKNNLVGTGTITGTTIYGSTNVCSAVGKFTSCIDAGSGTFSGVLTFPANSKMEGSGVPNFILASTSVVGSGVGPYQTFKTNNSDFGYIGSRDALLSTTGNMLSLLGLNGLSFHTGASYCERFSIASTGAATFACSVLTGDDITISKSGDSGLNLNSTTTNGVAVTRYKTTAAGNLWGTGINITAGDSRWEVYNFALGLSPFRLSNAGAASFACSVGIGTTLAVTGTTSLSCRLSIGASDQTYASIFIGGALTTGTNQWAIITDPQLSGTDSNYALYANARIKASTAVTNAFGVYIPSAEKLSGATITNNYALYIANQTSGATLNYSIYSSGGLNYFGGCVGIGINAPTTLLHICQTGQPATPLGLYSTMTLQTDSQANYQRIRYDRDGCAFWGLGVEGASSTNDFMISGLVGGKAAGTWSDSVFRIKNSNGAVLVNTNSIGSYGKFNSYTNGADPAGRFIGGPSNSEGAIVLMVDKYSSTTSTSQWFLGFTINNQQTASGVITANGASQAAFGSWSDRRLKQNITDLPNQLSNIMALRPVEFDYIESEGGGHQTSFIAQEFETIYPDAVGERPDGMKTLTGWGKTEAILVKAIQEQQCTINLLKSCIGIV